MRAAEFIPFLCFGFLTLIANTEQSAINPFDVIEECPDHMPQAKCMSEIDGDKCLGIMCLVQGAECAIDGCGGACKVIFSQHGRRLTDEECGGCGPFGLRDCDSCATATCPLHPDARCENRRCRTCRAAFFGLDRKEIHKCCSDETCPDGSTKFKCLRNPCDDATCPAAPRAECWPNYCGGCKAEFFWPNSEDKVSDATCVGIEDCPLHLPQASCMGPDSCLGQTCPKVQGASCMIDGCNGLCAVIFFKGRKRLTDEDCHGCPKNDRVPGCGNPCDGAACPNYPDARCEPQTCGTCKAIFYGKDRKRISDCGSPRLSQSTSSCPDGSQPFNCMANPCTVNSCPGVQGAVCRPNYCGGCKAEYFYSSGGKIPEYGCVREKCPGDMPQASCQRGICDKEKCPMYPDAECYIDGCGGCRASFYDGRRRLTNEDCFGCPATRPKMDCGDPCHNAHCPMFPTARCEPRVCGECGVAFYGGDRKEIKDCCRSDGGGCPPGVREYVCEANPCDVASCPAHPTAKCKPNYCGGCNAEFYLGDKKLTDIECLKNPDECIAFTTCFANVCNCPAHPKAQCVIQYCAPNQCKPLYFDEEGSSLSYEDCGLCADGSEFKNCGPAPQCFHRTCDAYPNAQCRSSNCGVCKRWFEDENGNTVDCEKKSKITCKVPSRFPDGRISPDDRTTVNKDENVLYKCNDGFRMVGRDVRKCLKRGNRGRLSGPTPRCIDINECRRTNCGRHGRCINSAGSYTCTCSTGYIQLAGKCQRRPMVPKCPVSFHLLGGICIHQCDSNVDCVPFGNCCFNGCGNVCRIY